jgi:hypothetical protein
MKAEYEQCQSHICSGTINSSMSDSYFSITTFPLKAVVLRPEGGINSTPRANQKIMR